MKIIPREARKITYSTEIRNLKKRLTLSEAQRAFIIGTVLGDANLDLNWSGTNYRLRFSHSAKQKDYMFWKLGILRDWFLSEPRYYTKTNSYFLTSISHPEITSIARLFLKNGKKSIPENIFELLNNPLALAVWFMDDGGAIMRNGKFFGYHLNSQSFTQNENEILSKTLTDLCGISVRPEKNHGRYRLRINKSSAAEFKSIVANEIIPSMKYKLG